MTEYELLELLKKPEVLRMLHEVSDLDRSKQSQHHTLGKLVNQASPGGHIHDGKDSLYAPGKVLTQTVMTANSTQNIVGGLTTITGTVSRDFAASAASNLDATVTVTQGKLYVVTAVINLFTSVAGDVVRGSIAVTAGATNGTMTSSPQPAWTLPTASRADSRRITTYFLASATGSVTFAAQAARVAGTGNINSSVSSIDVRLG